MNGVFNYEKKWKELNSSSKDMLKGKSVLVEKSPIYKIYLFSDFINFKRAVIITMPNDFKIRKKLPEVLGVRCNITPKYGGIKGNLFVIEQKYSVYSNISELFMSEISRILLELKNIDLFESVLIKIFEDWKSFFIEEIDSFGLQKQVGLYGEMYFMYNILFKELGIDTALRAWKGYKKNRHDFELPNISFEIKATTSNNPLRVKISNEKQLEKGKLKHLYLGVYNIVSSEAKNGDLPRLMNLILESIKDVKLKNEFKRNVMSLGYNFENDSEYSRSYSIVNQDKVFYEVDETFPSIGIEDLVKLGKNTAIMEVSYTINLDACSKYICLTEPKLK